MAERDSWETTVELTVSREPSGAVRAVLPQHAILVVIAGPKLGHRIILSDQPLEIGRGTGAGLQLDADSVSRRHARIEWTGETHKLIDLGSTNGTFVNEMRVSERELSDGDRPQIGKVLLKYIAGGNVEGAYHEEVQRLMRFDGLTGAYNKSYFEDNLNTTPWRTRSVSVSLIVFDLDHFKEVNDTHGHTAGDAVLRQAAAVVAQQVPPDQLFARVGGEEFAVLCPGAPLESACQIAERIRAAIEAAKFVFDGVEIPVTVSLGCAEAPPGSTESAPSLYERADARLYAAKSAGRNCVRS